MTIGVVGLGLIGGSVGLALRDPSRTIIGFDSSAESAKLASDRFCVDRIASLEEVAKADVVFIAVPPDSVVPVAAEVASLKGPETILTDCASVKTDIAAWAKRDRQTNFVPGHPMAGHEKSGAGFASAWMFRGARWIITPTASTSKKAVRVVEDLVRAMGATPVRIEPANHDRHIATLSHLPHVLAAALLELGADLQHADSGAGSWRDLTRVGGVDPVLWTQILMGNREQLALAIGEFEGMLAAVRAKLESGDAEGIREFLDKARAIKQVQSPEPVAPVARPRPMRKGKGGR